MRLVAGSAWQDTGLVFTNVLGEHLAHVTVYKQFKKVADSMGIPSARFHDLRHANVKATTKIIRYCHSAVMDYF